MTQLDDLKAYLKISLADDDYTDAVLTSALAAESVAQGAVLASRYVSVVATNPALTQALFRRVSRNLAMRALPLALNEGENGTSYVGAKDPEVRRLEGPYRKRVVG